MTCHRLVGNLPVDSTLQGELMLKAFYNQMNSRVGRTGGNICHQRKMTALSCDLHWMLIDSSCGERRRCSSAHAVIVRYADRWLTWWFSRHSHQTRHLPSEWRTLATAQTNITTNLLAYSKLLWKSSCARTPYNEILDYQTLLLLL